MKKDDKIGLKIVNKEEKFWNDILDKTKHEIETLENMLKFNNAILKMVENKIKYEDNND